MLVNIDVHLKSVYHETSVEWWTGSEWSTDIIEPPSIILKMDEEVIHDGDLPHDNNFKYCGDVNVGTHTISLEFLNKHDSGVDHAVVIDKILFFSIESKKVLFNSTYIPKYPKAYKESSLNENVVLDDVLTGCNYMGWNGTWKVNFDAPVFTWLHKNENLGWIYPKQ